MSDNPTDTDRRISTRRPLHGPVAVMIEGGQVFHADLLNINTTGIGIAAPFNVAPGADLEAISCFLK